VQITDEPPPAAVGGIGKKIGFVFPSYYCNLPRAVHAFVEKLEIKPDTYIFAIVTMGGPGQGSVAAMNKLLKAKGLRLDYGRGIKMPANNVLLYNPADPDKSGKALEKTDAVLQTVAADIKARMRKVKSHPFILRNHFKNIETLDAGFVAGDGCTGCGLCEKICPVRNIRIENGKPQWLHRCELCVACICWCPARAIENGSKTKSRRRYRNPKITVDELERKQGDV
jgi:ferredoxin